MSKFAANLKFLRHHKGLSQDILALALDLKRTTLSSYENDLAQPNLELLDRIAAHFGVNIDTLLRTDMSELSSEELEDALRGEAPDIAGRHLRVLATSVSADNEENVEVVPAAARAGYVAGYADPEFIASLPHMSLPFLSPQRKYRAFPVMGDSMPPVAQGSYVVGEYAADWNTLHKGQFAIVVTREDGIVFKKIYPDFREGKITLSSTNQIYEPYEVPVENIAEIWAFVAYISQSVIESALSQGQMEEIIAELRRDVSALKNKMGF